MDFKIESNRIYALDEKGELIAEITYPELDSEKVVINHTFVGPSLSGQGVAAKLTEMAYQEIKKQDKKAVLTCIYAVKWFDKHQEYQDILAEK